MGRLHYTVRQGDVGDYKGPTIAADYQHPGPDEPEIGDVIELLGRWRVVDHVRTQNPVAYANLLIVKNAL